MWLELPMIFPVRSGGVKESTQFVARVDIWHETFGWLWDESRQRRIGRKAPDDRVTIESLQQVILAMPITIDCPGSSEKGLHLIGFDVHHIDIISHTLAKGLKQTLRAFKIFPHRLPERHVLGDQFLQFHSKSPMLKSAT